jgi:hypothetical protein
MMFPTNLKSQRPADRPLAIEDVLDGGADRNILFAILRVLILIHNRLPGPDAGGADVFVPAKYTLATTAQQTIERTAPGTSWLISVESIPAGMQLDIYWGEFNSGYPYLSLYSADSAMIPAKAARLLVVNPASISTTFTVMEVGGVA